MNPDLEYYAEQHSAPQSEVLRELERETHLKVLNPRMIAGHIMGAFLQHLSCMIRPRQILEIGTFTGYSAICLHAGLRKGGLLHTIEIKEELQETALKYFERAGIRDSVRMYTGNALDVIPLIHETFDLVFLDADKEIYTELYLLAFEKVTRGGYIVADNALWGEKVLKIPHPSDWETIGIMKFNDVVTRDPRVENVLLPLRDGVMLIRKL